MNNLELIKNYNKVKVALAVQKALLHTYQIELNKLIGPRPYTSPDYSKDRVDESQPGQDIFEFYLDVQELNNKLVLQKATVEEMSLEKKKLDAIIEEISRKGNDAEIRLFYYHYIKQLNLYECAKLMNYSYSQVKRVNARVKKL